MPFPRFDATGYYFSRKVMQSTARLVDGPMQYGCYAHTPKLNEGGEVCLHYAISL